MGWVVNALAGGEGLALGGRHGRTHLTAATAGVTVPATTTTTVVTSRAVAGPAALRERQKVPYMTGRSTR